MLLEHLLEETEVEAQEYQHDAQYPSHGWSFNLIEHKDSGSGEYYERSEYRQEAFPCYILHILKHHYRRRRE